MQNEIPQEQLERIQPLVDRFLIPFQQLELTIPLETDSAVIYQVQAEPPPEGSR